MIILPSQKTTSEYDIMEPTRDTLTHVSRQVILDAPCSVGILVDHCVSNRGCKSSCDVFQDVVKLFFKGCDDQEALSYDMLMADRPRVGSGSYALLPRHLNHLTSKLERASSFKRKQMRSRSTMNVSTNYLTGLLRSRLKQWNMLREL
ncbi:hypothetical protein KSP40_PGU015502 [Platanthera guangdongensis]|uniref:Uncharacterized protein n=1 Tax=Platanthera guangdongensis TaxID=2320717 RepID=A0ABR2MM28_9ASPA